MQIFYKRVDTLGKISGSIYCKKCNNEIKWCYLIPQNLSETRFLQVETVPEDTIIVDRNPLIHEVKIHCRSCDCINIIIPDDKN